MQIKPTGYGLLMASGLLMMLASTFFLKSNFGLLMVFTLIGFCVAALFIAMHNLMGLEIKPQALEPVFAGAPLRLGIIIQSKRKIRYALVFRVAGNDQHVSSLLADQAHRLNFACPTRKRGEMKIPPLMVSSLFPLGLYRVQIQMDWGLKGLVYPQPLAIDYTDAVADQESPSTTATNLGDSDEFSGLKSYQPGDPLSRLYWKALARKQGLMTKEFAGTAAPAEIFRYQRIGVQGVENKLAALCFLVVEAHRHNKPFGIELPDQHLPAESGQNHLARCLAALALFTPRRSVPDEHE
jgi:uncharacterized protein (DUF58 family)